jgi:hypothetical protein
MITEIQKSGRVASAPVTDAKIKLLSAEICQARRAGRLDLEDEGALVNLLDAAEKVTTVQYDFIHELLGYTAGPIAPMIRDVLFAPGLTDDGVRVLRELAQGEGNGSFDKEHCCGPQSLNAMVAFEAVCKQQSLTAATAQRLLLIADGARQNRATDVTQFFLQVLKSGKG